MIANDIGRGLLRITSEHTVLLVNRVSVVAVTCLAVLIAITNADIYVLDWNYMSMALRGAGVFVPLSLAIFRPHWLAPSWAIASMAASTAVAVIGRFSFGLPVNPLFTGLTVSVVLVGIGLVLSRRTSQTKPA